jgi:hypothetical protein
MRKSPSGRKKDALLIPIGVLGSQMAQEHAPGAGIHRAGDPQSLGAGFGANDSRHFVIHYFDYPRRSHRPRSPQRNSAKPPMQ